MFLILETEFNSVSIFTSNKLIFIHYFFRNGIFVAKGNSILPANVPAINLRRKIRPFQFSSLIPFLIPFYPPVMYSHQQLATEFYSVSNICSNIFFPFLFRF